jgi:hypothetical protein
MRVATKDLLKAACDAEEAWIPFASDKVCNTSLHCGDLPRSMIPFPRTMVPSSWCLFPVHPLSSMSDLLRLHSWIWICTAEEDVVEMASSGWEEHAEVLYDLQPEMLHSFWRTDLVIVLSDEAEGSM